MLEIKSGMIVTQQMTLICFPKIRIYEKYTLDNLIKKIKNQDVIVYKNRYIQKSRIEIFYQANIKSGHKILGKLERHIFLF